MTNKIDHDDLLSRTGAGLLADAINTYWRDRGFSVLAKRYELHGYDKAWGVRSTLLNGLPREVAIKYPTPRRQLMGRFT